jgi:uncharacterized membrane protein YphA (DoxX/SURF4 family)
MKKYEMSYEQAALVLRVGLGLVMFSGGLAKLSKLLAPSAQEAMVNAYMAPSGYINQFFIDYLFSDAFLTPWVFLTSLSTFEFFGGVFLIIGFAVRPVSLIFGLAFWSFIIALPVVNTPGVEVAVKTHTAPALLVMIRDVALSGMMFTIYNLGPGPFSIDKKILGISAFNRKADWDSLGLLLRLSLGVVFVVGGAFYGLSNIKAFAPGWILLPIGLVLVEGKWAKYAGYASIVVLAWYMFTHLSLDKSLIANLNGIKREFALLAAGIVLCQLGGGDRFTLKEKYTDIKSVFIEAGTLKNKAVKE